MKQMHNLVIAIDGPAGAGKSTIAKLVAKELGIKYLDTGAMYRAIAWIALRENVDMNDESQLSYVTNSFNLDVESYNGQNRIIVNGQDITNELRRPEISEAVSYVASNIGVRQFLLTKQREIGKNGSVLDGRDIGTNVFPNADFKFFLTADLKERAQRRMKELIEQGYEQELEDVKKDVRQRDELDQKRTVNPLKIAEDAVIIDTTDLSIEEVVKQIIAYIENRVRNYG